ncbi:hypothetical protein [uncultured Muribaculum sp.]|uniref:hypothetical protein n=1 Tax=uncultured Muribaculum sp. TaxID=1918613 RepID=UPI002598CE47|nr:hypothetical protein [uncultured Muribaculum sp.]
MILSETSCKPTLSGGVANAPPPATDRLTFQVSHPSPTNSLNDNSTTPTKPTPRRGDITAANLIS